MKSPQSAPSAPAAAARFALHLLGALRNARVHGTQNRAFLNSIAQLTASAASLQAVVGETAEVRFLDEVLLVNGQHVRLSTSASAQITLLSDMLSSKGVGGLAFRAPAQAEVLAQWVFCLLSAEADGPHAGSLQALAGRGLLTLEPRALAGQLEFEIKRIDRASFAFQAYVRLMVGFSEFIAALKADRDPFRGRLGIVRVIQDLIEITTKNHALLLDAIEAAKAREMALRAQVGGYSIVHAANTCVLSLIVGRTLGLERLALLDLGTAALLAKAGFALLPESVTEKPGALTPKERTEIKVASIRAVQTLLSHARLNDVMMRRIVVSYEHQRPYFNRANQSRVDTHVYSRIVAIADAYDAMTSRRAWRDALPVETALRSLQEEAGTRFDPALVSVVSAVLTPNERPLGPAV